MPFGGRTLNPTAMIIDALEAGEISHPESMKIEQILLPVTFMESFEVLQKKIREFNPDVIICFGQAAGRDAINLESVALNILDADIPDNLGEMPQKQMINHLGKQSYLSTLPLFGIEGALKDNKISVKISNSAGTYVCNYLFYRLMETNQDTLRLCGFIHVPLLPEQAKEGEPTMSLDELKKAVMVILNYINY